MKTSHILIKLTKLFPSLPFMFVRFQRWVYDASKGRILNTIEGSEICVLTVIGAKTGKTRKYPLMYVPYEQGVLLVASRGGAPNNPAWYYNVKNARQIGIHHRGRHLLLSPRQATVEEKSQLWPICVAAYPSYGDYQAWSSRDIPVFICLPVSD